MLVAIFILALLSLEGSSLPQSITDSAGGGGKDDGGKGDAPNATLTDALNGAGAHEDNYTCVCHEIPSDDDQFTMRCHCRAKAPVLPPSGNTTAGNTSHVGTDGNGGEAIPGGDGDEDESCPYACPYGWTQFGFSENCYLLPPQPVKTDTFWNHQRWCQQTEKTSYIMVVNGLIEQAAASVVSLQYAPTWIADLGNAHWWLGGYSTDSGYKFLDGSDQTYNLMMTLANLIGSQKNGSCVGADPKTLGVWQTTPCSDKTGSAICEMPKRRVCGKVGGMLPISPISLSPASLANLFPKLPSIPFIGQILGESRIDQALTGIGKGISWLLGGSPDEDCPIDCPAGWISWTPVGESCYSLPPMPVQRDTFWNMVDFCKKTDPKSYPVIVNGFMEQVVGYVIGLEYSPNWLELGTNAFIWLGGYTTDKGWQFLDGSDASANILMTFANLPSYKNGSCLGADWKTLGFWQARKCDDPAGIAICEQPKRPVCGAKGTWLPIPNIDLTPSTLIPRLFPKAPTIPFLDSLFSFGGVEAGVFNPWDAEKNNKTGKKYGDTVSHVMCAKAGTGLQAKLNSKPDWIWLYVENQEVEVPGKWTQFKCKNGVVDAFKVQPATYIGVWSRCHNLGYEVAMPANYFFSGWTPFQVKKNLTAYYFENSGLLGKLTATYEKVEETPTSEC